MPDSDPYANRMPDPKLAGWFNIKNDVGRAYIWGCLLNRLDLHS